MWRKLMGLICRFRGHRGVDVKACDDFHVPEFRCVRCGKEFIIKYRGVGIDDMSPELWNSMTLVERYVWRKWWNIQGRFNFGCLLCGYPTASGQCGCDACAPIGESNAREA